MVRVRRSGSLSSDGSRHSHRSRSRSTSRTRTNNKVVLEGDLPPPVLVYHESARSIVFRDHIRRAASRSSSNVSQKSSEDHDRNEPPAQKTDQAEGEQQTPKQQVPVHGNHDNTFVKVTSDLTHTLGMDKNETVMPSQAGLEPSGIANYTPQISPLPPLALGPSDEFEQLTQQNPATQEEIDMPRADWSPAEAEVVRLLQQQRACVKTIRNGDWTAFLKRFETPVPHNGKWGKDHADIGPHEDDKDGKRNPFPFNSFVTSTSLLPEGGKKMRCFGSTTQFTTGVVFALPSAYGAGETEDDACKKTRTWSWPSGYSAKTEFNIDGRGNLINGREEALTPLSTLREYNHDYVHKEEYTVAGRTVSGLSQIPYNEIFLRVGGRGRIVNGVDVAAGIDCDDASGTGRSFEEGCGLPIALFVRSASFGDLIALLRTRSRLGHVLGDDHFKNIPLLLITPDNGTRVLTESLQVELWRLASSSLNPFQNPSIARFTTINNTNEPSFQQKVDELLDLDDSIREKLTSEELAHLAGGFGATDESVAGILKDAMLHDVRVNRERKKSPTEGSSTASHDSHHLQDFVNEGLTAAVRSGDYLTARQLLILYTVVATKGEELSEADDDSVSEYSDIRSSERSLDQRHKSGLGKDADQLVQDLELVKKDEDQISKDIPPPPPPPPLDTDRLRGATNSDGLLAVLGAAQILKAMQDGTAKKRTEEVVDAVDDWCKHGEQSMAFRISSWYDQRAAQGDLQIATENDSNFMAFVSNKAIANRRGFADQLRQAVSGTDFTDVRFLRAIEEMVNRMHSPCLRLELLQYVLGLDNRFSVLHVGRSVHLAATCLGVSSSV